VPTVKSFWWNRFRLLTRKTRLRGDRYLNWNASRFFGASESEGRTSAFVMNGFCGGLAAGGDAAEDMPPQKRFT